ncbi:MAG: Flp family type IVb pilin [Deltaproteobacteria bacterium]|nr:Flp family type IVb pilin [Deltaproteobacteria bacterium]
MKDLFAKVKAFAHDEEGATAIEYGIMIAAIAAVIIGLVYSIGLKVNTAFNTVNNKM